MQKQYACFSAAMYEGIKRFPAIHGPYTERDPCTGKVCGTCAIGAGMAVLDMSESSSSVCAAFPYMRTAASCPIDDCMSGFRSEASLAEVAIQLYEGHGWTRTEVADWLYAEEEKLGFTTLTEEASECVIQRTNVAEEVASVSALRI
jgi:hypothetical protein